MCTRPCIWFSRAGTLDRGQGPSISYCIGRWCRISFSGGRFNSVVWENESAERCWGEIDLLTGVFELSSEGLSQYIYTVCIYIYICEHTIKKP